MELCDLLKHQRVCGVSAGFFIFFTRGGGAIFVEKTLKDTVWTANRSSKLF